MTITFVLYCSIVYLLTNKPQLKNKLTVNSSGPCNTTRDNKKETYKIFTRSIHYQYKLLVFMSLLTKGPSVNRALGLLKKC